MPFSCVVHTKRIQNVYGVKKKREKTDIIKNISIDKNSMSENAFPGMFSWSSFHPIDVYD